MKYLKGGYNLLDLGNLPQDSNGDIESLESFDDYIISKELYNEIYTKFFNGKPCMVKAEVYDGVSICEFLSATTNNIFRNVLIEYSYVVTYYDTNDKSRYAFVFGKLKDGRYFFINDSNPL